VAILPRCFTSGFSTTSAQYNLPLTGWTNSGAGVSGTAPQAGDTVVVALINNTAAVGPPSQIAGSPFTFLVGPTTQAAAGSFFTVYAIRQWTGGESTPSWLFQSGTRIVWVAVAITPDAGQQLIVDAQATEKIDGLATSHTGPSVASPGGSSDFALLVGMVSAGAAGNTAITFTTPASWTLVSSANNVGTAGQFVDAVGVWYRQPVTSAAPGAQTIQGGSGSTGTTNAVMDVLLLREVPVVALPDVSGATEAMISGQPTYPAEFGAGVESFAGAGSPPFAEYGAAGDETISIAVSEVLPIPEAGGAADGLLVAKLPVPTPVPGLVARIASPAFILSRMPRMHVQNLITGQWLHRDVQGVSSPSITWALNTPDSFTCTLAPPRPDMLTAAGEPLLAEWRDACYLEENDEIKFGGILTSSSFNGPQWGLTFTGFMGYPAGMPYEGPDYVKTRIDALDVVRDLWAWLQGQPNANIHMDLDATDSGTLLGANVPAGASSTLLGNSRAGSTVIKVHDANPFNPKMKVSISGGAAHIVKSTSPANKTITLTTATANPHQDGDTIAQVMTPTPIAIYWYNSTDIGQEIGNIQTEAVFDMWETHNWTNPAKAGVRHRLHFGVPRAGKRQATLRFAEGENVVEAVQGSRDGAGYANDVVGLGSGQGKSQIRAKVAQVDGRLRRVLVYTDGTITTKARMQSRAQRILASRIAIDTPTTVVVKNHPNAPFGSFVPGDDIYVIWATGWRNTGVWGRITSMSQDPTTDLMSLTLARSDSFTYLAQSGQAGTV
jgi:hypothetical protein